MRYYLDTNILIFILSHNADELTSEVSDIIEDCSTILYVSSVPVKELILLFRIGKVKFRQYASEQELLEEIKKLGIKIVFFNEHHFDKYAHLQMVEGHKYINDHAIIAQAISDKISLISSDHEFKKYISQGLSFVFNKR